MKVLLINPPREHEIVGNNPVIIEKERGCNPPLGLLYLAGYLEAHSAHEVRVIDAQVENLSYPELCARFEQYAPDVVGISVMTFTAIDVLRTIEAVKSACPAAKVVLGGPHVHLFPQETIGWPGVDFLVLGEGEEAFAQLLEHLGDPRRLSEIPGLVFRNGTELVNTGLRPAIRDLDAIPFPARRLVPYEKYRSLLSVGKVVTTVFTSRGCPFKCSFCDRPHLGKTFRCRTPGNVVDELEQCTKLGIHEFLIYDDTFTVNRPRVVEICDEIVRRKLDIGFDIRARVDTVDELLLQKLKRAGCQGIHYGVEAGSDEILKRLEKGITVAKVRSVFDLTRKADIPILAYFMIGNPGERMTDIENTFRLMRELRADYVHLTILTPFPGTKLYAEALERKIIRSDVWREFARAPREDFVPPVWGEHFSREQLGDLLVQGYRSFYCRPSYILKRIAKVRSWNELKKKGRAAIKVFLMRSSRPR